MSIDALVGKGTKFKRGDGASNETFIAIAEVNAVGLPNQSRPMIDVTDLSDAARVFRPGLLDSGTVTLRMNFTRDAYIAMRSDLLSDSSRNYQIVLPDSGQTTITFAAYVQDMSGDIPDPDQKIEVNVTFKITGEITVSS